MQVEAIEEELTGAIGVGMKLEDEIANLFEKYMTEFGLQPVIAIQAALGQAAFLLSCCAIDSGQPIEGASAFWSEMTARTKARMEENFQALQRQVENMKEVPHEQQ